MADRTPLGQVTRAGHGPGARPGLDLCIRLSAGECGAFARASPDSRPGQALKIAAQTGQSGTMTRWRLIDRKLPTTNCRAASRPLSLTLPAVRLGLLSDNSGRVSMQHFGAFEILEA